MITTGTLPGTTQTVAGSVTVEHPSLTKGTQGAAGVTTQDLKDAGRNTLIFYQALPIVTTATDTLMSLAGYKSGAAVTATTTPAVVSAGKIFRVTSVTATYVAIATGGTALFTIRANLSGVVALGSPAVLAFSAGATLGAGNAALTVIELPDGLEFAAGTGVGVSMQGRNATGTAAAVGYGQIRLIGFEY